MPELKKLRAGFVGAGHISEYHAAALKRIPNAELIGVCDLDQERSRLAAEKFDTRAFTSLEEMVSAGVDVIHVLTPPASHAPIALKALELGCHVLVEKPLAVEVEDCGKIAAAAEEKGLQVCVNH